MLRKFLFPFLEDFLLMCTTRFLTSDLSRRCEATVMFENLGSVMRDVSKAKYA